MKRLPQLDGIRGVAILVVMLHNQRSDFPSLHLEGLFEHAWMGVDLFFALSGFLITGILLDAGRSAASLRNFYARRCLRIWPLYYAVLLFMFVAVPLLYPSKRAPIFERSFPWWSYPLFLQNLLVGAPTSAVGLLGVTWSLAIEEQFYLVWPWVVRSLSRAQLGAVAAVVIGAAPPLRLILSSYGVNLYANTFCRLDGLMWGALLAVAVRSATFQPERLIGVAWLSLAVGGALALVAATYHVGWLVYSLSGLASIALVYLALFASQEWFRWLLMNRFIVYTGVISYGLFLLHKIPFDIVKPVPLDRYAPFSLPIMLGACYAAATVSWVVLERPLLRLRSGHVGQPVPRVPH